MPLPDYSKFKADIKRPKKPLRAKAPCSLQKDLGSLPMAEMDEESRRRRSSGERGYDMGLNLFTDQSNNHNVEDEDVEGSMQGSISKIADPFTDPFYMEQEEEEDMSEEVTESYEEEDDSQSNLNNSMGSLSRSHGRSHCRMPQKCDGMSKSVNDVYFGGGTRRGSRRTGGMNNNSARDELTPPSTARSKSLGDGSGKLGNFLDRSIEKDRKRTALLPGSTTDDLCSEMNEVVSMLGSTRKRSGRRDTIRGSGTASRSSSGERSPKLRDFSQPSTGSSKLRDYSQASGEGRRSSKSPTRTRRTPRRTTSHDISAIRKARSEEEAPRKGRRLPPKSKTCDGSKRVGNMPMRSNTEPKKSSHTHNSFVTGSRIRRIQPGGGASQAGTLGHTSQSNLSGNSSISAISRESSFRSKQREQRGLSPSTTVSSRAKNTRSTSPNPSKPRLPRNKSRDGTSSRRSSTDVPPLLMS